MELSFGRKTKPVNDPDQMQQQNQDLAIDINFETLPNYHISDLEIIRSIGRGTFGDIYLANSNQYGRVAVKRITFHSSHDQNVEKLLREAKKEVEIMRSVFLLSFLCLFSVSDSFS